MPSARTLNAAPHPTPPPQVNDANATVMLDGESIEKAAPVSTHTRTPILRLLRTNMLGLLLHICFMAWWVGLGGGCLGGGGGLLAQQALGGA
jgi:hypothetical protein